MWREGKVLVMRKGGDCPDRCIKCNAASVAPERRYRPSWHSPWWHAPIFLALLLYAIVAMIVRKTATIHVGLCERHRKRVMWGRIVGGGGLAVELALVPMSTSTGNPGPALVALALALPWLIAAMVVKRLVRPVRIDDQHVHLEGCGPDILRSLPDRTWN